MRLKRNIDVLVDCLEHGIDGYRFDFFVVSAAPQEVVNSALEGIVPPERIIGTQFEFDATTGEIRSVLRVPAGYGKVAAVDGVRARLGMPRDR